MFTSSSAAPSATMGDTHIAHSLAGTAEYTAAPCQRGRKREGGGWRWRKNKETEAGKATETNKNGIRHDELEDKTEQKKKKVLSGDGER